jgi:tRNA threonylcarbamoyladenosine biosynthesis protein TsaB
VQTVLADAGVAADELGEIRIGVGPGSFTGLRIGMSFAKGLAVAARVKLQGVSTFEGVAWVVCDQFDRHGERDILVVSDARRAEVFWAAYRCSASGMRVVAAPAIAPLSAVSDWCQQHPEGVVATPLREHGLEGLNTLRVVPEIAQGLLKVECSQGDGFSLHDVALLEPTYLRAVAAKSIAERTGA